MEIVQDCWFLLGIFYMVCVNYLVVSRHQQQGHIQYNDFIQQSQQQNDQLQRSIQNSTVNRSHLNDESNFSPNWTQWSHCNNHCKQIREKHCINAQKCVGHVLKEERHCLNTLKCLQHHRRRSSTQPGNGNQSNRETLRTLHRYSNNNDIFTTSSPTPTYPASTYSTTRRTNRPLKIQQRPYTAVTPTRVAPIVTSQLSTQSSTLNYNNAGGYTLNMNNGRLTTPNLPYNNRQHRYQGFSMARMQQQHQQQQQQQHSNSGNVDINIRNQLNNDLHSAQHTSAQHHHHDPGHVSRPYDRVIKQSNHGVRGNDNANITILRRSLYTKWSNWTKCTRSCQTQRFKHCKKKGTCKKNVIKETAYCYVEGSPCHRWIADHFGINYDDDSEEEDYDFKINNLDQQYDYKTDDMNLRSNCGVTGTYPTLKIVGGRASLKDRWPWQVAIMNKHKVLFCGGTLIAPQWILTAAHCLRKHLYVRINDHDISFKDGSELEYRIQKMVSHPEYNVETVDNDVALLKLPYEIPQTYACLPRHNQTLPYNMMCTITGWGKRGAKDEHGTKILHETEVPIVPRSECRNSHKNLRITSNMFCAGFKHGGRDSCAGDSGGPLVCQSKPADGVTGLKPWVVHGITSFGEGCGRKSKYGVYIAVDNYVKWIHEVIKNN